MVAPNNTPCPKKILLVEEQKVVLRDIIPILQQFGYDVVDSAKDGNDAIELTEKHDIDLILMGINIPGLLNGIDAARIICSSKNVPIIYLTASADTEIINRARDTKPFGYLISPVSLDDLHSNIESALEREASERKVRDSEERFRLAAEASGNLIYDYDIPTGTVRWCGACAKLTGLSEDEMALVDYESWMKMIHPDDREYAVSLRNKAIECHSCYSAEYRFQQKDSSYIYIEDNGNFIFNHTQKPRRMVGTLKNINARKQIESVVQLSEEKFAKAFNSNPALMAISDTADLRFIDVNQTFLNVLGYSKEEVIGKTPRELRLFEDYSPKEKIFHELERCGLFRNLELRVRARSGELRDGVFSADIIELEDQKFILTVLNDITEQRRIENEKKRLEEQLRQSQKIESIGRLAGGVAHDFNNLLTAITGNISLALMDTPPASRPAEFLQDAMKAADSAASFIRQLLAFSSRQVIEPKIVSPNELIAKMQKMIRRLIGEDIIFSTSLEENVGSIKIDPAQFEQIIINLTANARDAMPNGGNLSIETKRIDLDSTVASAYFSTRPGAYILVSVSDTGCGMTNEIKQHVFEPFYSTKSREKGTGLGLSTVYRAVKQNNGLINLYSEVGKGTTFKIYFPREETQPETPENNLKDAFPASGNETIVVVEDDKSVREIVVQILTRKGYTVHAFESAQSALEQIQSMKGDIHLLISDIVMPVMDGLSLSRKIRKLFPKIRILLMSGYSEEIIAKKGAVMDDINFISKPFTPRDFTVKVRKILDEPKKK